MATLKVLVVDDQPAVRTALETLFEVSGLPALAVGTPEEALSLIATDDIGAVVQDMNFAQQTTHGAEGIELYRAIRALDPDMPVLLMTAWTALETAVALIKEGAADYIAKPWDDEKLVRTVRNLVHLRCLQQENLRLRAKGERARRELAERHTLVGLVYTSAEMHELVRLAVSVAPSDAPVLITGPNGSGKEKVAEIIQANSRRQGPERPFVRVNMGALPEHLFEAELFGAEPGAFTGAARLRVGRFEAADGGTLFLDEIGTLPLAAQAKLLRVLQTGEFERLGSSVTRRADVRLISATNANLPAAIAAGRFREDLFFRLNVIELQLPPLCDRVDDVLPLAEHFLAEQTTLDGRAPLTLSDEARTALCAHDWPGNVRELRNRIRRAVLVAAGDVIGAADLGLGGPRAGNGAPAVAAPVEPAPVPGAEAAERAMIEETLVRTRGVVSKAAAELGLSRQAFYRRMERLGIVLERRPR